VCGNQCSVFSNHSLKTENFTLKTLH